MTEPEPDPNRPLRVVGRYAVYGKLATGGMATVHFGRLLGPVGFSRTVAIKRLHPQFAKDPEFVAMFLDEARLAARIQHPNVVATLDVVARGEELFLVMDYIRGEAFSRLIRTAAKRKIEVPGGFIGGVVSGMLHGLHAAHEATDERGQPLRVVHRDVSPQNVLVGTDGVARVLDFGVAKAAARIQITRDGQMKGKLSYMSPEQLSGKAVDRRSDVFAAGVVLWEALTGRRLFASAHAGDVLRKILHDEIPPPSQLNPRLPPQVDELVARSLAKDPDARFSTAREFAIALETVLPVLCAREVGEWVEEIAGESLEHREQALAEIEGTSSISEFSALTPSEPSFIGQLGKPGSYQAGAPWSAGLTKGVSRLELGAGAADDALTSVYRLSSNANEPGESLSSPPSVLPIGDPTDPVLEVPLRRLHHERWILVGALATLICAVAFFIYTVAESKGSTEGFEGQTTANPGPTRQPQEAELSPLPDAERVSEPERHRVEDLGLASPIPPELPASGKLLRKRARVPASVSVSKPAQVAGEECVPPYIVGEDGIRRGKPNCL